MSDLESFEATLKNSISMREAWAIRDEWAKRAQSEIDRLTRELAEAKARIAELEVRSRARSTALSSAESRVSHLRAEVEAKDARIAESDDYIREANKLLGEFSSEHDRLRAEVEALTAANAALVASNDAMREDAERYRWLREQHWHSAQLFVVSGGKESVKLGVDCPSQQRLDAAIDAAIAAQAKGAHRLEPPANLPGSKVCPNKNAKGVCPHHNLHCSYPKCEQ